MERIDVLVEKRRALYERIRTAEDYKKEIVERVQRFASEFSSGKITFFEYHQILKDNFGERTPEEWVRYYDRYMDKCREELKEVDQEIFKLKVKSISKIATPIISIIFLIFISYLFVFNIEEPVLFSPIENYIDDVDFTFNESGEVVWKLEKAGRLNSFKISGRIEGEGNVRVFLEGRGNDVLILDSDKIELNKESITGRVVDEINNESLNGVDNDTSINNESENISIVNESKTGLIIKGFSDYCIDTCDLFSYNLTSAEYNVKVEIKGNAKVEINKISYEIVKEEINKIIPEVNETKNETLNETLNETKIIGENEKIERKSRQGKEIVVKKKQGARNVELRTQIPDEWKIEEKGKLKVYWKEGNREIEFNANDLNNDGNIDEIKWMIDNLDSDQTFEIIVITKAEHLDSNRSFISDIYEEVRELDENWSETIFDGEYVRVTFEIPLDNTKDITIFPRVVSGAPKIEVYEIDKNETIVIFENLIDNEYNKVYLTSLNGTQDTFDLKVVSGSVELEHMIDPYAFPGANEGGTDLRAQVCNKEEDNPGGGTFNFQCDGTYPAACGSGANNDRLSCNDGALENATSNAKNRWGGIKVSYFNSSVVNCESVNHVELCYEWWQVSTQPFIQNCDISVDANGGASWTVVNNICPGEVDNPGLTCINVTAVGELWTCSNFFGASGTKALIKSEFQKAGGRDARIVNWDVLSFNVSYTNMPPVISEVNATNITQNFAIINWTTDYETNSSVNYGSTKSLGINVSDTNLVIKHNISLTGLSANTLYYYNITSCSNDNVCSTNGTFNFTTLAIPNEAPQIEFVNFTNIGANQGGVQNVLINFTVTDGNGFNDLNNTSTRVEIYNLSLTPDIRVNDTCSAVGESGNSRNYTCEVGIWYFDPYGRYVVNVTIADNSGERAENSSRIFDYLYTAGFDVYPSAISWPVLDPGQTNIPAIENLTINNTGNVNFTSVNITAYNLSGVDNNTFYIPAENFSASTNYGNCGLGTQLDDERNVSIESFNSLAPGNLSFNDGTAQEEIFFCLVQVPSPLPFQVYSTSVGTPWEIMLYGIASFALSKGNKKRRKRKIILEKEKLLELFGDRLEELLEIVKENKMKKAEIKDEYQLERSKKNIMIPLEIFRQDLGAAEVLCKYLKENIGMRIGEIANLLKRDRRTISLNYKNAAKTMDKKLTMDGKNFAGVEIFSDRRLSILENAIYYLREKGKKNKEIALILGKDQRNVWTIYSRAVKKVKNQV